MTPDKSGTVKSSDASSPEVSLIEPPLSAIVGAKVIPAGASSAAFTTYSNSSTLVPEPDTKTASCGVLPSVSDRLGVPVTTTSSEKLTENDST